MNYTIRKALDIIKTHNLRPEYDSGLRRYHLRDVDDYDVQRLADVWDKRDELLRDLQQLDHKERQLLEQYASIANGVLYSRQVEKDRAKQQEAEQRQEQEARNAAAEAEKQAFYANVRRGFVGTDDEFEQVAKRLWLAHVAEQTQRNMDATKEFLLKSGNYTQW